MAGFDPNNPPTLRGFYSRVKAKAEQAVIGGTLGTVAVPLVGDWGPQDTMVEMTSSKGYDDNFGANANDSRLAVIGALTGDGLSGSGASKVVGYRMPLSGSAKATRALSNTTPAVALTLSAKYKGTKGNAVSVTVQDHPTDGTKDQLLIYDGTTLKETYSYTDANITNLAAQLNDSVTGSAYVTAVANVSGVALAHVTSQALTGGANGTPIGSDFTAAMTKFQSQDFNIFMLPNMTDPTIRASVQDWVAAMNDGKRRILLIEGGAANETLSDAIGRSAETSTDPNVVNFGYNMFSEDATGNVYSTAQMVGYFAGMIAAAGITASITFDRLDGFDIVPPSAGDVPNPADVTSAINGGVVVFSKDTKGIRVEAELTTFTDKTDADRPIETFSSIKEVRTLHQIDTDLLDLTEGNWIGKVANTPQTRVDYLGALLAYFRRLEGDSALQTGMSSVSLDATEDNTGDTLWPVYEVTMTKTIQRVLATGQVS